MCSLDKDDKPPRPRIILLGETGVGKSTFGNRQRLQATVWSGDLFAIICRLFRGYNEEEDYDYDETTVENHLDSIVQVLFSFCDLFQTLAGSVSA